METTIKWFVMPLMEISFCRFVRFIGPVAQTAWENNYYKLLDLPGLNHDPAA